MQRTEVRYRADKGSGKTVPTIIWENGRVSEYNPDTGRWSTEWGNGAMVEVDPGSEHSNICDEVSKRLSFPIRDLSGRVAKNIFGARSNDGV